jgi:hypothetical protein
MSGFRAGDPSTPAHRCSASAKPAGLIRIERRRRSSYARVTVDELSANAAAIEADWSTTFIERAGGGAPGVLPAQVTGSGRLRLTLVYVLTIT